MHNMSPKKRNGNLQRKYFYESLSRISNQVIKHWNGIWIVRYESGNEENISFNCSCSLLQLKKRVFNALDREL